MKLLSFLPFTVLVASHFLGWRSGGGFKNYFEKGSSEISGSYKTTLNWDLVGYVCFSS